MTRQKVDPDKRQRTAHACDSCKRRKQKCDGKQPCAACFRRQFNCSYAPTDSHYEFSPSQASSSKRRSERPSRGSGSFSGGRVGGPDLEAKALQPGGRAPTVGDAAKAIGDHRRGVEGATSPNLAWESDDDEEVRSNDEEAEVHTMVRMLEDSQGRLQYIGDSANISFLQLLRMIVETISGPSAFSLDVARHKITEREFQISSDLDLNHLLPDKETAMILVEAFFTATHGMIEIFIERSFIKRLEKSYQDPSAVDNHWLCHLYLVLAMGFGLVTPKLGSRQEALIHTLRARHPFRSEEYYFAAKTLADPLTGFEDAGFWSIQALTLMALYMLNQSRRNTAYVYAGMAIRSAHALGVHREEVLVVFQPHEQQERRKLWRTLYILDVFLSVSLGRPLAISDGETTGDLLFTTVVPDTIVGQPEPRHVCAAALEATIRSCHAMERILRKIYYPRKISIYEAQMLAQEVRLWPKKLPEFLYWRRASNTDIRQAVAILHCNVMYCHCVVLLCRPFFLHLLSTEIQIVKLGLSIKPPQRQREMQKFSDACMDACTHTIAITYTAYTGGYLPRLDHIPSYCVFAAALVVFANEVARPTPNALSNQTMQNSISVLEYCGQNDPSAARAAMILRQLRDVIQAQDPPSSGTAYKQESQQLSEYQASSSTLPDRPHYQQQQAGQQYPQEANMPPPMGDSFSIAPTSLQTSGFGGPIDFHGQGGGEDTYPPWAGGKDEQAGQFPFSGFFEFDNVIPSVSAASSVGDDAADESLNFDRLWEWPTNSAFPSASQQHTPGKRATHRGPYDPAL